MNSDFRSMWVSTISEAILVRTDRLTDSSSVHESGETIEASGDPSISSIPSADITAAKI